MESDEEIEASFDDIRKYLNNFKGGSVNLEKNYTTGVATMCFRNKQKRNAITGKYI